MNAQSAIGIDPAATLAAHGRWLRTVILARVGEIAAVDDVFQEVALAVARQCAQQRLIERVEPFLYRLAVRQTLLYRRRAGRQRRLTARWMQRNSRSLEDHVDPGEWLLALELQQSVRDALQTLAAKDREILLLKYTEDWTYHQLAAHLGIGHSAVEARLHRARQRLRDRLIQASVTEAIP
jgi:RNA polymerase sigma-70 factor (ECF subfamily)